MIRVLLVVAALTLAAPAYPPHDGGHNSAAPVAPGGAAGGYVPPVDGAIVDRFRPPPKPWDAGNRGIDYAPALGTPVQAAAEGVVTFAGHVGGTLHVTIVHPDGVRTSYSFLQTIAVAVGDRVRQGQCIGTSGTDLHFGARIGDRYLDPESLFGADDPPEVHLVTDDSANREQPPRSTTTRGSGAIRN
jgi:murein DD-endopeptidase MepM/ murein hydrolase activator NlpD